MSLISTITFAKNISPKFDLHYKAESAINYWYLYGYIYNGFASIIMRIKMWKCFLAITMSHGIGDSCNKIIIDFYTVVWQSQRSS